MANLKLATQRQQEIKEKAPAKKRTKRADIGLDFLGVAGLGSMGWGIYQVSQPWAFIVMGAIIFTLALLASRA